MKLQMCCMKKVFLNDEQYGLRLLMLITNDKSSEEEICIRESYLLEVRTFSIFV